MFHFKFIFSALFVLTLCFNLACQETAKLSDVPSVTTAIDETINKDTSAQEGSLPTEQLTKLGINSQGQFSSSGKKIIYVSKDREHHSHPQIYELDLDTKKERRITHQDGFNEKAVYLETEQKLVYASTTDEIKERPEFIRKALEKAKNIPAFEGPPMPEPVLPIELRPLEIYSSLLDGSDIIRLTESEDFDSHPSVHPKGKRLVFSSLRSGDGELYSVSFSNRKPSRLTFAPGFDGEPSFSADGSKLAWVRFSLDWKSSYILVGDTNAKGAHIISTKSGLNRSPSWHTNGNLLIFSSNLTDPKNFEIFTVNIDGSCIKQITHNSSNDIEPVFSPDGQKILFTSNRSGRNQLHIIKYDPPETCLGDKP